MIEHHDYTPMSSAQTETTYIPMPNTPVGKIPPMTPQDENSFNEERESLHYFQVSVSKAV